MSRARWAAAEAARAMAAAANEARYAPLVMPLAKPLATYEPAL